VDGIGLPAGADADLAAVCETAMREGRRIDLTGCYHEITGPYAHRPCNYYPLLAGLARTQRMSQILDIGTRYGGSILSVSRGRGAGLTGEAVLVTVDTIRHDEELGRHPEIIRVQGDSIDPSTVGQVVRHFRPPIDLVYLDAIHTYEHTRANIAAYAVPLAPAFLVLDDIHLNASMKRLWAELCEHFGDRAYDASELTGRGFDCGFGVIRWRSP
jgi:cephalosporin hydroxylase